MAIPVELFRFRVVRNIQAQKTQGQKVINLVDLPTVAPTLSNRGGEGPGHTTIDPDSLDHWLTDLSTTLALRSDSVLPTDLTKLLPDDWAEQVGADGWRTLNLNLAGSLADAFAGAASHAHPELTATVEALTRLLRLQALVESLKNDLDVADDVRTLKSTKDVRFIAQSSLVILPKPYFSLCPSKPIFVREPGFTDFYVVRDEWNRYEAGELARVINVLPGETFDSRINHRETTETIVSTTVDSKTSEQTENSQRLTTSLSQTSTTDASLNIGVQGQVQVSAQYGPAHIDASAGGQVQASLSQSETKAFVTATENVQRSVKEVSKIIVTAQTRRTVETDSTLEHHKLSNNDTTVTVGLYRWLSEVHRVQLWRYPNCLVLEFEIPEPGAWLRWAMLNAPTTMFNQDPGPFRLTGAANDLSPLDLDANTLAQIATQWRI